MTLIEGYNGLHLMFWDIDVILDVCFNILVRYLENVIVEVGRLVIFFAYCFPVALFYLFIG